MPELANLTLSVAGAAVEQLPRCSGVYRFFGAAGELLYVGKSVDIHARVVAHINEGRKPGRHQRIMAQVAHIDCELTAGEFGALLLENAAIKAETPLYNRRQRRVRKLWSLRLERGRGGGLQPRAMDFSPFSDRSSDCYGLFHNKRHIDSTLRRHARDHGLCLQILGLERGSGPCFQFQLGRCDGACAGAESLQDHDARLLSVLDGDRIAAWPFAGPLLLVERTITPHSGQPERQFHLVNHWTYLTTCNAVSELPAVMADCDQRCFDRDAYHLMLTALRGGKVELRSAVTLEPVENPLLGVSRDQR